MSPTTAATRKTERANKQKMDQYQEAAAMEAKTATVPVLSFDQLQWITPTNKSMTKFRRFKAVATDARLHYSMRSDAASLRPVTITRGAFDTRTKKWCPAELRILFVVVRGSTTFYSEAKIFFTDEEAAEYMRAVVAESGFKDCTVWLKRSGNSSYTTFPFPPYSYEEDDIYYNPGFITSFFVKLFDVGEGAEHTMRQIDDALRYRYFREREAFEAAEHDEAAVRVKVEDEDEQPVEEPVEIDAELRRGAKRARDEPAEMAEDAEEPVEIDEAEFRRGAKRARTVVVD